MSEIEELTRYALKKFHPPYSVDITKDVLEEIKNRPNFMGRYYSALADYAFRGHFDPKGIANRYIGRRVKQITRLSTLNPRTPCDDKSLAKTYTQLG